MSQSRALEIARELGFDLAGIAPVRPPRDAARFDAWIAAGRHAGLEYLARDRDRIVDPRRSLPEGRSMLVVGLAHSRAAVELAGGARIARYAAGRDYHNVIGKRLRKLRLRLIAEGLIRRDAPTRNMVDAAPLLERSHAAEAGLGFASKAANLLHPSFGPWFFLGEILLDVELPPTTEVPLGSCGTCTACIDACPTQAIVGPGQVDARRCISYHTIEGREAPPRELRADFGSWVFGCDVCSEVCPWGRTAPNTSQRFGTHAHLARTSLVDLLKQRDPSAFEAAFEGSPLRRAGASRMARNAALALGNVPSDAGRIALLHALTFDAEAVVREMAAWSLSRAHRLERGVRAALDAARAREPDSDTRAAIADSLDEVG